MTVAEYYSIAAAIGYGLALVVITLMYDSDTPASAEFSAGTFFGVGITVAGPTLVVAVAALALWIGRSVQ